MPPSCLVLEAGQGWLRNDSRRARDLDLKLGGRNAIALTLTGAEISMSSQDLGARWPGNANAWTQAKPHGTLDDRFSSDMGEDLC